MSNRTTNILATCLLTLLFVVAVFSIKEDSLTTDELAHLPAGYSYLTQRDMRLNPEHPPLIKDISALPLLFIKDIKFPSEIREWKEDVNGQWGFGTNFLFRQGNPADKMIFAGRVPMILILVLLGFYVFKWTKELFGKTAGLLALFFFSFSPTLLAHGRLVTTDVGAAAGVFIATYYFLKFLKEPSKKNIIIAGIFLGLAELTKFSLILLFPFFAILLIIWSVLKSLNFKGFLENFGRYFVLCVLVGLIALTLIWAVYQYHTWDYPPERQVRDTESILSTFGNKTLANSVTWMADKPVLRPLAQYSLGILMILQRTAGGNTAYFLGEVSSIAWKTYFPVVYLIKEPLAFHILLATVILYLAWLIRKSFWQNPKERILIWLRTYFPQFAMLLFVGIYWATSISGNLNIGVRHLLPVFPFTILLVAGAASLCLKPSFSKVKPALLLSQKWCVVKKAFLAWLILWQAYSLITIYPHFITYFNELVGGADMGHLYVVDSNLDWGQDLKRLAKWTEEQGVDKIYLDYFGGANPEYYLKEKHLPWQGDKDPKELPKGSYFALSISNLQVGQAKPAPDFINRPNGYYRWLNEYTPIARIGYSIFVYYID